MKRALRLPIVVLAAIGIAAAAAVWALWTAGGTGAASGSVGTLAAPTNVAGVAVGNNVTVSWTGAPAPDGGLVDGYYVERHQGSNTNPACGSSSSSLLPAAPTACIDSGVADGTYTYTVIGVFRSWTATSAASAPVTVLNDTIAPTLTIAFPADGGLYGATRWNAGGGACSSAVCGTASDAGAGVAGVQVSIRQGSGNYWNALTSSFSSPVELLHNATGTTSWNFAFPASNFPIDTSYTVRVVATDAATNSTDESRTFSYENTPPVTTDDTASIGNAWKTTAQTVTLTPTDSGSGVAATYYTTDGSTPTTGSSQGTSVALSADGTYTVKYFSVDNAGNAEAVKTAGTQIRIDAAAPADGALTVNGTAATSVGSSSTSTSGSFAISRTDYSETASSTASGLASSTLVRTSATLSGDTCGTFGSPATLTGAPSQTLSSGCHRYVLTGTDAAGNSASVTTTVKVDTTAPSFGSPALSITAAGNHAYYSGSGTTAYYNGTTGTSSSITVSAPNVVDADTGVAKVNFPAPAGFSGGGDDTTSPYQATYTWSSGTASGSQTVTATNGIANTATTTFSLVRDVTAPTGGALTVNGTAATGAGSNSWNRTGSFTIGTRTNYAETQSGSAAGLKSSTLTRQQATFTNSTGACGTYGSATTVSGNPSESGLAEACYLYTLTGLDNVGNTVSISTVVKVDKTNPTVVITDWEDAGGNSKVRFVGTGEPGGSVSVMICTTTTFPCSGSNNKGTVTATVQSDGTWVSTDSANIGAGTFNAQATETDLAGNTGTSATFTFSQS